MFKKLNCQDAKTLVRLTALWPVCLFSASANYKGVEGISATPADWDVDLQPVKSSKSHKCASVRLLEKMRTDFS